MPPLNELNIGYWGSPTSTLDWCENNYEVRSEVVNDQLFVFGEKQPLAKLFGRIIYYIRQI